MSLRFHQQQPESKDENQGKWNDFQDAHRNCTLYI